MKTKMYFFFRGIAATMLLLFFCSFAMANVTANNSHSKNVAVIKEAKVMVFNDSHNAVPGFSIRMDDYFLTGNEQQPKDLRNENEATQSIESYGLVFSPHKSSAIITVKFIDVKSLGDIIPQNDNMIVVSRKFRDQTTNGLKVSTHFTLQDLQDFNLS